MARNVDSVVPGTLQYISHKLHSGIVLDNEDMSSLSLILRESSALSGVMMFGWCILPTRVDVLILPLSGVTAWSRWTFTTYTMRHHVRHGSGGGLWRTHPRKVPVQAGTWAGRLLYYMQEILPNNAGVKTEVPWPFAAVTLAGEAQRAGLPTFCLCEGEKRWIDHALAKGSAIGDPAWMDWYARMTGITHPPKRPGRPRST